MNHRQTMQHVLEYIDEHIRDDLDADRLASLAGYSTYHFQRVFQWSVGFSVMGYVRSRRLAFAASELSSKRRIIDIAMDYGFETHSGFSKAFRRWFGCTPETYRLHACYGVPPLPSLDIMDKYAIGGIVMEPRIIFKPATTVAGYAMTTRNTDGENSKTIPAFWWTYINGTWKGKLHSEGFLKSHDEYGVCFAENPETGEFEYLIGLECKEGVPVPSGYETRVIPAATYAVFSTPPAEDKDFSPTIQGVWQFIFSEWFPGSGYEYAPGCVDYEFYPEKNMGETGNVCEIFIPIVRKAG